MQGNCGSTLCVTVGPRNAEILAELLGKDLTPHDRLQIPRDHGYIRLLVDESPMASSKDLKPIGAHSRATRSNRFAVLSARRSSG